MSVSAQVSSVRVGSAGVNVDDGETSCARTTPASANPPTHSREASIGRTALIVTPRADAPDDSPTAAGCSLVFPLRTHCQRARGCNGCRGRDCGLRSGRLNFPSPPLKSNASGNDGSVIGTPKRIGRPTWGPAPAVRDRHLLAEVAEGIAFDLPDSLAGQADPLADLPK